MGRIRRIAVGIKDPGARSMPAVAKAARLAEAFGAELTLFHAIAVPVPADPYLYASGGFRKLERETRDRYLERLERIAERLRSRKLEVRVDADWDYPVYEAIVRHARRIKADLVVTQAHVGRRLAPWLLHLTDWELLRTCPVPVLIVKSPRMWQRPRVLAAIDPLHAFAKPAGLDDAVLEAGAQVSAALQGSLHAMHAYTHLPNTTTQFIGTSESVVSEIAAASEAQAKQVLRAGAAQDPDTPEPPAPAAGPGCRGDSPHGAGAAGGHRGDGCGFALRPTARRDRQYRRAHPRRPALRRAGGQAGTLRGARIANQSGCPLHRGECRADAVLTGPQSLTSG